METAHTRQAAVAYIDRLEKRDWPGVTRLLAEDLVYEIPQSRERITGRDGLMRFNMEFPGDWHLALRLVVADGRRAALWLDTRIGEEHQDACIWLELNSDGLISRITDYWPEAYDPPPGREHLVERY